MAPTTGSTYPARGSSGAGGTTRRPPVPFRFAHVDLHHPEYNPVGTGDAQRFRFPYPDASFDLAIATSVFTHLLDGAAANYVAETARVLTPGGRLFATWLVLDPERSPDPDRAMASFQATPGAALVADPSAPEAIVAYPLEWIAARLADNGLRVREPYQQGSWTGRPGASLQDLLVVDRI